MASTAKLAILLTARDLASKEIQGLGSSLGKLGGMGKIAAVGMTTVATIGATLAGGLITSIGAATTFESAMSAVGAVAGASGDQLKQLSDAALALGQDTTLAGIGASDAAAAMQALAAGGVSTEDILNGAARGALLLASAGGIDVPRAAEIASNAMVGFGLAGQDVAHIADLLAAAANASSADVGDLGESLKYIAPLAHGMGLSIEEVVATLTELGTQGIKGSMAGTALRSILSSLAKPSKQAQQAIDDLGLSFFDTNGKMKSIAGISGELKTKLSGLTDQQRANALVTLFGNEALSAATILYGEGAEGITKYLGEVNKAGSAAANGALRNDNLKGSIEQLKSSLETASITLGQAFLPAIRSVVDSLSNAVNAAIPFIKQYGPVLVGALQQGIGVLMQWGGAVWGAVSAVIGAFQAFAAGKTTLAEFIGGMEIFVSTILGNLGTLAAQVAPYIGQFFSALGSAIVTYGPQILAQLGLWLGSLVEWFGSTAVPAIATAAGNLASALGGWITGSAIPYLQANLPLWGAALWGWITETAVPAVMNAATALATALGDWIRGTAIPYLAANMPYWIDALRSWILDSALPTIVGAVVGLANALVDWIRDAETRTNFNTWIGIIAGALGNALLLLIGYNAEASPKLSVWITSEDTKARLNKYAEDVNQSLGDVLTALAEFSSQAGVDLNQWIQDSGPKWLTDWGELWRVTDEGAAKIAATLNQWQQDLNNSFDAWLRSVTPNWLHSWGEMGQAVADTGGKIVAEVGTWPSRILGALGDLGGLLYNAGASLIGGLISGIRSGLPSLDGLLGDITKMIPQKKGPPAEDAKLLFASGQLIMQGLIDGIDDKQADLAKKLADVTSSIAKATTDMLGALKALAAFDFVKQSPSGETLGWFTHLVSSIVKNLEQSAADFDEKSLKATSDFADTVSKVGSAIGNAVNGLKALAGADWAKTSPSGSAMAWFTHLVASLVENFRNAAQAFDEDGMKQASSFAETAGKVLGIIGGGVDGLLKLNTFVAPSKQAIDNFLAAALYVVDRFGEVATTLSQEGIVKTTAFADAAGKALGATKTGVDAFLAFKGLVIPSKEAIDNLMNGMQYVIQRMQDMANAIGVDGLKQAQDFADAAGRVFATVKAGLELLNSLKTYKDLPAKAIDDIITAFSGLFERLGELQGQANAFEQQADTFLGTMQRAAQKIADGLAIGGNAPKIGTGLELAPNTGGFGKGGGSGSGGTVNNITVTGNTLLGDDVVLSQNLADIITPAQSRQVSYSY